MSGAMRCLQVAGRVIPLVVVSILILSTAVMTIVSVSVRGIGLYDYPTSIFICVVTPLLMLFTFVSFLQAALRRPHGAPAEFRFPLDEYRDLDNSPASVQAMICDRLQYPIELVEVHEDGRLRYCVKCEAVKPDRAHHCSMCDVCVLRMDHHCGFLGNCVGAQNHRYFLQMTVYGSLYAIFTLAAIGYAMSISNERTPLIWILLLVFACVFSITLPGFSGFHIYLICRNRTTLDNMSESSSERSAVARYDLGAAKNWRQIMGDSPLMWFLPLPLPGEGKRLAGVAFETRLLSRLQSNP